MRKKHIFVVQELFEARQEMLQEINENEQPNPFLELFDRIEIVSPIFVRHYSDCVVLNNSRNILFVIFQCVSFVLIVRYNNRKTGISFFSKQIHLSKRLFLFDHQDSSDSVQITTKISTKMIVRCKCLPFILVLILIWTIIICVWFPLDFRLFWTMNRSL